MVTIKAKTGFTFVRKHDNFYMGEEVTLGIDYSTGIPREDLPEYYDEVELTEELIVE